MTINMIQKSVNESIKWVNEDSTKPVQNYTIYKIIPFKYLLKWLEGKYVRLEQISSWDDKLELMLFNQNYFSQVKEQMLQVDMKEVKASIYGQSWSLCSKEKDELWRKYSPDCLSVKIRTTTNDLVKALEGYSLSNYNMLAYLGCVKYYSLSDLQNKLTNCYFSNGVSLESTMACSLFDKSDVLTYEEEFRLAIIRATQMQCDGYKDKICPEPYLILDIDSKIFIHEVCFDFRLDDNLYNSMKCCLQKFLPNADIYKSKMADFTPIKHMI